MTDRLLLVGSCDGLSVLYQRTGEVAAQLKAGPFPFPEVFSANDQEQLTCHLEKLLSTPYAVFAERGESVEENLSRWCHDLFLAVFAERPAHDAHWQASGTVRCD